MNGIYIHIPFCKRICTYCDFPKRIAKNKLQVKSYLARVYEEIDYYKSFLDETYQTIYIGGGTPNSLSLFNLRQLLIKISSLNINAKEYTIEVNPELLTLEQIRLFKEYGVNRISIGVETFNKKHLEFLGRNSSYTIVKNKINLLHENGFKNVSIDLLDGFYGETLEDLRNDLKLALTLNITHISVYNLILEEHTVLNNLYKQNLYKKVDPDFIYKMDLEVLKILKENGFKQYEISNYAKSGFESLHNMIYWKLNNYIGIGLGACGLIDNTRYENPKILINYLNEPFMNHKELLSLKELKNEFMMLGLRMNKGVSLNDFKTRFNSEIDDEYDLTKYYDNKLLKKSNGRMYLTRKGIELGNQVFLEFVD